jgi:putative ABC transport system permease protein
MFGIDGSASTVYVRTTPDEVDAVRDVLPATANPQAPTEVTVDRPSDALAARAATDDALTALLLALGGVALLVGGIGIANVMVISVLERRREIGVRRALGASKRHIRVQFVTEAVLLAAVGGIAGVVLGAVITGGYAAVRGWTVAVPFGGLAAGVGLALLIGALAGLYPAGRAARLTPAEAVRSV